MYNWLVIYLFIDFSSFLLLCGETERDRSSVEWINDTQYICYSTTCEHTPLNNYLHSPDLNNIHVMFNAEYVTEEKNITCSIDIIKTNLFSRIFLLLFPSSVRFPFLLEEYSFLELIFLITCACAHV